jgi:hypothetical protein
MRRLLPLLVLLLLPGTASAASIRATQARLDLKRSLGAEGVLQLDRRTGTPRVIARLDGFLTGPSSATPEQVALGWARRHTAVIGGKLGRLRLVQRAVAPDGLTSLVWTQVVDGIPSIDGTLRAAVDARGRLVWIGGSPQPNLGRAVTRPLLTVAEALRRFAGDRLRAEQVLFGRRIAWHAWLSVDSAHVYDVVVDARSGKLLRRVNRVFNAGKVKAWDYAPGVARGGAATVRDLSRYFTAGDRLEGAYTHTFLDTANDDRPDPGDEVRPDGNGDYTADYTPIISPAGNCPSAGCSWNHLLPNSWQTNLDQNAQQVFYFINHFADHLKAAPIGFDKASGNFESTDPVLANTTDGAASAAVLPNPLTNALNANMLTPPDGQSPRMQMYLFEPIPALAPDFADTNGGDDASVIYHEFTHGLTNRLVVDGAGDGALNTPQAGAMGEAWSDFYAMDFLITQGFEADTDKPGELILGRFLDNSHNSLRTEAVDCTLGASDADCPRVGADDVPQQGGYAYDAFGKILGSPEVHADSEIWSQTLFELRRALVAKHGAKDGGRRALALVTGGLRLSPGEPSFLDMRNSILAADTVAGGEDHDLVWGVFAHRGMGYDAQSTSSSDIAPVAGFALPPAAGTPTGTVSGRISDVDSGKPLAGVPAGISGFFSGLDSDFSALSGANGVFRIGGVPAGGYGPVVVGGNGYEPVILGGVTVQGGKTAGGFNAKVRRNWALLNGGTKLVSLKAKDLGCGPGLALDANPDTGISFFSPANANDPGPKVFTIRLPAPIDVASLVIDPSGNCGDDSTASLAGYKVEFSADGTAFQTASEGEFGDSGPNELDVPQAVRGNVRFVRMTMKSNQGGSDYLDMTELSLYGTSKDTRAPVLRLRGGVRRGPRTTLRGRVSDDYGVTRVVARGRSVVPRSSGAFRLRVRLRKGVNRFRVTAFDGSQNRVTKRIGVRADLRAPKLRRLRAVPLASGLSRVSGLVSDDTGVRRVKVAGRRAKVRRGAFAVTVRGRHPIVVAIDRAGRRTRKRV